MNFREYYSNRYLTGSLAPAFFRTVLLSVSLVIYLPLFLALFVMFLIFPGMLLANAVNSDYAVIALAVLASAVAAVFLFRRLAKLWATFRHIVHARRYVLEGGALATVEGPPVFSGGIPRRGRSPQRPPNRLTVGGVTFDLDHCRNARDLLRLSQEPTWGVEPSPQGIVEGFRLRVPLRVFYVPSHQVVARVGVPL